MSCTLCFSSLFGQGAPHKATAVSCIHDKTRFCLFLAAVVGARCCCHHKKYPPGLDYDFDGSQRVQTACREPKQTTFDPFPSPVPLHLPIPLPATTRLPRTAYTACRRRTLDERHQQTSMQGNVCLFDSAERRGIFSDGPKPLALLHETISVMWPGRFPEGQTEIPFEAEVRGIDGMVRCTGAQASSPQNNSRQPGKRIQSTV